MYIQTHIPQFCPLRIPRAGDTLTATSTLSNHILASKYHLPFKGTRLLGEKADTTDHPSNLQDEVGTSCSSRKQSSTQKMMGINGHGRQHRKTIADCQTWDQLQHPSRESNSLT